MSSPPLDDAWVDFLATNNSDALAALVKNPAIAARVRQERLGKPTRDQTMIQGRATALLLQTQLGETDERIILLCVLKLHYGGKVVSSAATKAATAEGLSLAIRTAATELANLICQSPTRRAAHLERLRPVHAAAKRAFKSEKTDSESGKSDRTRCDLSP
jgi:hypothetical protein